MESRYHVAILRKEVLRVTAFRLFPISPKFSSPLEVVQGCITFAEKYSEFSFEIDPSEIPFELLHFYTIAVFCPSAEINERLFRVQWIFLF